ncbi:hypothetical protein CR513_44478, partial [Mucuna pruriens]
MPGPNQANYQQHGPRYHAPPFRQQLHQQMPPRENNSTMEDLILQFQQNITTTIHYLKMQVGQLANTSASSGSIPSQTILNLQKGGVGTVLLRSSKELPQPNEPQPNPGPTKFETEPRANSRMQQPAKSVPLPFPNRIVTTHDKEIRDR